MVDKIINLNRARKSRARSEKRQTGDDNAVKFGRSKAEKTLAKMRKDKADGQLDQNFMGDDDKSDDSGTSD